MKRVAESSVFNVDDRIGSKLLENHTHMLSGEIEQCNIDACIKWILYENLDRAVQRTLTLYINSTGGDLYGAFALIDVMKQSFHSIRVVAIGSVMSSAFLIFASGTKGERYASSNTSFMCHQYSETFTGKHHDLRATMREGENCNTKMINILQEASGLTRSQVKSKLISTTDIYLTTQEVLDLNIADHIL